MTKLNNFKKNWSQSDSGSEKWMGKHEFVRLHQPGQSKKSNTKRKKQTKHAAFYQHRHNEF